MTEHPLFPKEFPEILIWAKSRPRFEHDAVSRGSKMTTPDPDDCPGVLPGVVILHNQ